MELYEALVGYVSNLIKQNGKFVIHDSLMFNICNLNSCKYCTLSKGSIEESDSYEAVVFPSKFVVSIEFLLWHSAYCRYSFKSLGVSFPSMVNKTLKERFFLESWVLLQASSLLVIYTDRVANGIGRNLLTPILIDDQLNIEICSSKPYLTDQYRYTLAAVINHYAEDARGNYSSTLFSKERIVIFDDINVTNKSKSIFKSKTFKGLTHLLF